MTYDEIIALGQAYADRYDQETTDNLPQFMLMVEARVNRLLKTREQSARAYTATVEDQEYYSLPPDFAGMRDVQINSDVPMNDHSVCRMNYLNPEQMNIQRGKVYSGESFYTVIANQLQIYPKYDAGYTIEMVYYQRVPALNPSNQTNWLSDSHPDIYNAGMVAEIELFAKHYVAAEGWHNKVDNLVNELDTVDDIERWSGSSLVIRTA